MMLDTLRNIVQAVNAAPDLKSALLTVVEKVEDALETNASAIYLLEPEDQYFVLRAARGLSADSVGEVRMSRAEGLVGLVGSRAEPLNLEDGSSHPNFEYFPETGEEIYKAFLGVPIIHHKKVLGVLVAQRRDQMKFDEQAEAFLITLASQLAVVLAHAEATGALKEITETGKSDLVIFDGAPGAPGVGQGIARVIYPAADLDAVPDRAAENIESELKLFDGALESVKRDMEAASDILSEGLGVEEQALFDVYLKMLDDNALGGEIVNIIESGQWAQGAVRSVIQQHVQVFETMEDIYLRERASDIRDLGRRLLAYLQVKQHTVRDFPEQTVLIGEEISPADIAEIPRENLAGIVTLTGSQNSHIAILARAMEIPMMVGAEDVPIRQMNGMEVILDGYQGKLFPSPSNELKQHFEAIILEEQEMVRGLEALSGLPAETKDAIRIPLRVNTGLLSDVARSRNRGAEGVGLYRTEVPFMMTDRFPSETQQIDFYRQHLEAFNPHPVTMRTLDVGGDKALPYFPINDANPFLGWRGIRITLDHPEIFLVQLRAMLKASEGLNNLRIMLPMISNVTEVEEALHHIHQAYHEVREEGCDVIMPEIGVMIEVPAAVYQARELAQRVDFLSVGSNDLTQYLLAVDRNNSYVADLYHAFHPAVLKALKSIVNKAHLENKPVSVCGELAGDVSGAILLAAMGYDELSMNSSNLLKVKSAIRSVNLKDARVVLDRVMQLDSADAVHAELMVSLEQLGLEFPEYRRDGQQKLTRH